MNREFLIRASLVDLNRQNCCCCCCLKAYFWTNTEASGISAEFVKCRNRRFLQAKNLKTVSISLTLLSGILSVFHPGCS